MKRNKNMDAVMQIIVLIFISIFLLWALCSGKVNYYVHPRFKIGLWISVLILIAFILSLVPKVKKARHNSNLKHYVILFLPVFFALAFPATGVSGKSMDLSDSTQNLTLDIESNSQQNQTELSEQSEDMKENTDTTDSSLAYDQYEEDGVIKIKEAVFSNWYFDVYVNTDDFIGKRYQYLAQVYSVEDFTENQFLAGRYFMVCCAADVAGYGILCESDERSTLIDDEWIMVTGTIETTKYHGETVPILTDVIIDKSEAPEDPYIYYSYY